jgi:hypothetical protein
MICRDDGQGGCLPCDDFQCVPAQPDCTSLNAQQCQADPRCVVTLALGACPPNAFCDTSAVPVCQNKPPNPNPDCSLIPVGACALVPACEVQDLTVCSVTHAAGQEDDAAPKCGVLPPGGCTTTQICTNKAPVACEDLAADACTANPNCELQNGPVCEIACLPNQPCPPCATPTPICVTRPSHCETKPVDQCATEDGCMVETFACPAICEDDGNGGCLPCNAPPARCVDLPAPQPEPLPAPPVK